MVWTYVVWLACLPREFFLKLWCLLEKTEADQAGWKKYVCVLFLLVFGGIYKQLLSLTNKSNNLVFQAIRLLVCPVLVCTVEVEADADDDDDKVDLFCSAILVVMFVVVVFIGIKAAAAVFVLTRTICRWCCCCCCSCSVLSFMLFLLRSVGDIVVLIIKIMFTYDFQYHQHFPGHDFDDERTNEPTNGRVVRQFSPVFLLFVYNFFLWLQPNRNLFTLNFFPFVIQTH